MNGRSDGPEWTVLVKLSDGPDPQTVSFNLEKFLWASEYEQSFVEPLSLVWISMRDADPECFWLFHDDLYVTDRPPRASEREEVILRIKADRFRKNDALRRLREQVANFEAVEVLAKQGRRRNAIPDDVKLLVWTRDGGVCVKCERAENLHFDHIIPHSRGGGDHVENIQLLCRACNLAKSDNLA